MDDRWTGPYEIVTIKSKGRFQLKSQSGTVLSKLYHGALLKEYRQPTHDTGACTSFDSCKDNDDGRKAGTHETTVDDKKGGDDNMTSETGGKDDARKGDTSRKTKDAMRADDDSTTHDCAVKKSFNNGKRKNQSYAGGQPAKKKKKDEKNLGKSVTDSDSDCIYQGSKPLRHRQGKLRCKKAQRSSTTSLLTALHNPRSWLADTHINHVQSLLQQQFPTMSGFQDVGIFKAANVLNAHIGTPDGEFVQIINIDDNHWITVANVQCPPVTVRVYDSLGIPRERNLAHQLAWLLYYSGPEICIEYMSVQRQVGSDDCGLFSAAFATALCSQHCPTLSIFDQSKMRRILGTVFSKPG